MPLLQTRHAVVVSSMMDELIQRGGLKIALSGRDEARLAPVVKFITKYITNPHFSELLLDVTNMLFGTFFLCFVLFVACELFFSPFTLFSFLLPSRCLQDALGRSMVLDELFVRLRQELNEEIQFQKQLCRLQGSLDMLVSSASTAGLDAVADEPLDEDDDTAADDSESKGRHRSSR